MKTVQITPGAGGGFHCDNCLRDNALVLELRRRGHDVLMVPLYLPMAADGPDASRGAPIFFGGINVYLQQKWPLLRRTPRWLDRLLDSPRLLACVARRAAMTRPQDLGEPTLSMLRGEEGRQVKELERLVAWLAEHERPDLVCLSNALLLGMARRLKQALGVPVVSLLQDEDAFLDSLPEPHRAEAWDTVRRRAAELDGFIATSRYFREVMVRRLGLPPERAWAVHAGLDAAGYEPAAAPPQPPAIGFTARLCEAKGLDTLVDAFLLVRSEGAAPGLRLRAAGMQMPEDREFVSRMRRRLAERGADADAEFLPAPDRAARQRFLQTVSLVAAPARQAEAFGLFALEAMAAGVPVVLSRVGSYPELVEASGGGVLVEPDDPAALAAAIGRLLARPDEAGDLAARGRRAVLDYFSIHRMADETLAVFEHVAGAKRAV
ncbi:MAG: glycosyltransferase family 4 protein [Planctomycetes bacterium]|nr:glycosyltransferase family 4 protein [Planctomycetota bacterium]